MHLYVCITCVIYIYTHSYRDINRYLDMYVCTHLHALHQSIYPSIHPFIHAHGNEEPLSANDSGKPCSKRHPTTGLQCVGVGCGLCGIIAIQFD